MSLGCGCFLLVAGPHGFGLRYAHTFYGDPDGPAGPQQHAGGLDFPGGRLPDYMDFAYFSFVIGMTFQVSDVQITSREFRKLVLLHGMLSFGFNTVILALTINTVSTCSDGSLASAPLAHAMLSHCRSEYRAMKFLKKILLVDHEPQNDRAGSSCARKHRQISR